MNQNALREMVVNFMECKGIRDTKTVSLVQLDWDKECRSDFAQGKAIWINEQAYSKKSKSYSKDDKNGGKKIKNYNGILSPFFATDWSDDDAFRDRYRCKCGELQGAQYVDSGEVCDKCGTEVEYHDVDYTKFGWISLGDFRIITPNYFMLLQSLVGKQKLKDILSFKKEFDINGQEKELDDLKPDNPFLGIGISEFYERYDEILFFFYKKNKKKRRLYEKLFNEKKKVFSHNIPVYSSILRPESFKQESFFYNSENGIYSSIVTMTEIVRDYKPHKDFTNQILNVEDALSRIQEKLMKLDEKIFNAINKKTGFIKKDIIGGRLSWTSRCVIIPDSALECDQIKLPYLAFLEMYKFEIIGYFAKINNVTEAVALQEWNKATLKFSERIYEIMQYIVRKDSPTVAVNRNPTINYGSFVVMQCVEVKRDFKDLTLSLPIAILKSLNADFDGDTLNIIAIKTKKFKKKYIKAFSPKFNFYVDRETGLFNSDFDLLKDEQIGLWDFNNFE